MQLEGMAIELIKSEKLLLNTDYFHANQQAWNQKVMYDVGSEYYSVKTFILGENTLFEPELELLGNVEGKEILHLQCYFGLDTMSLSRLGANVVGLDFSESAIKYAQKLSLEIQTGTEFLLSNVYDIEKTVSDKFDIVFSSYGAICWLPDLNEWAKNIFNSLKLGGEVIIVDFHPLTISTNLFRTDSINYSYFNDEGYPIKLERKGTYANPLADIKTTEYNWNHSIGEIISAFINNGFVIESFNELPYVPMNGFPNIELQSDGYYHVANADDKYPLIFSLKARKNT